MSKFSKIIILFAIIFPFVLLCPMVFQSNMLNSGISQDKSPEIKLNDPPSLSDEMVNPPSGDTNTIFVFQVTYGDFDNDMPTYIYVFINNTPHSMTKKDSGDITFTDGCIYNYTTTLVAGEFSFFYSTSDGSHQVNSSVFNGNVTQATSSSNIPGFVSWIVFIGIISTVSIVFLLKSREKDLFF